MADPDGDPLDAIAFVQCNDGLFVYEADGNLITTQSRPYAPGTPLVRYVHASTQTCGGTASRWEIPLDWFPGEGLFFRCSAAPSGLQAADPFGTFVLAPAIVKQDWVWGSALNGMCS